MLQAFCSFAQGLSSSHALLLIFWWGAGGRAVSKRLQESTSQLKDDAVNAAKISVFVLVTLLGVLYVLDY